MQVNLLDVLSRDGSRLHKELFPERNKVTVRGRDYPIVYRTPVDLTVVNAGNKVLELTGKCRISTEIPCDRCLKETVCEMVLEFERKLDMKLSEEERGIELDENSYLEGTDLDVDTLVYLEILMNWPQKVLCREDCAGLCPVCGKNLNDGPCGCRDDGPKDPRMAAISDIFSKYKEV